MESRGGVDRHEFGELGLAVRVKLYLELLIV